MLTGDNRVTAEAVARRLGIDRVEAEVLPDHKSDVVNRLRAGGPRRRHGRRRRQRRTRARRRRRRPRDGFGHRRGHRERRRHPAQGRPDRHRPGPELSQATMSNIRQNLVFAFVYNVAGIPIAAGVLYPAFGCAVPDDRRRRHGPVLGQRHRQRPAAAHPTPVRMRSPPRASIGDDMRGPSARVAPLTLSRSCLGAIAAMAGLFHARTALAMASRFTGATTATMDAAMPLVANGQPHEHVAAEAPVPSMVVAAAGVLSGTDDGRPCRHGPDGVVPRRPRPRGAPARRVAADKAFFGNPLRMVLGQLAIPRALLGTAAPPDRHRLQVHRC